jgi:hypothetical protein
MSLSLDLSVNRCRRKKIGYPGVMPGIMEDAVGDSIQETGQEHRLARMAGHSSLDSEALPSMEAGEGIREFQLTRRGEG